MRMSVLVPLDLPLCPACRCGPIEEYDEEKRRWRIFCGHWRINGCPRETQWFNSQRVARKVWRMHCALLK